MVPKRNQEGPRKEIEVGIEWMRGERKKMQSKKRRKAAGSVREERKERYTYVVSWMVPSAIAVAHFLNDYLSSLVFHSLPT